MTSLIQSLFSFWASKTTKASSIWAANRARLPFLCHTTAIDCIEHLGRTRRGATEAFHEDLIGMHEHPAIAPAQAVNPATSTLRSVRFGPSSVASTSSNSTFRSRATRSSQRCSTGSCSLRRTGQASGACSRPAWRRSACAIALGRLGDRLGCLG